MKLSEVIGVHLLGYNADEVINLFSLAIRMGMTVDGLKGVIYVLSDCHLQ